MEHSFCTGLCACGKQHPPATFDSEVGSGAIRRLPEYIAKFGASKVFLLADTNTFAAAGQQVCQLLDESSVAYSKHIFTDTHLMPDERSVGNAVMNFDASCNLIIGIGSGVINDIGKILSNTTGRRYIIVGTAPSMDGYASATSSMELDGLKVSVNSRCPDVIIGDTDILRNAPLHMLQAGIGDMLAKYVSIAEWRISHLVTGEYCCDAVADLVRTALKKCTDNADGLLKRDENAVEAVFEGLLISGLAMNYAGISRPASGVEHYFSHVWDMRGLQFGTPVDLHGIQCAVGTAQAVKLYNALKNLLPNEQQARAYVESFSYENWKEQLRAFLGRGGETMIEQEKREGKYNKASQPARFSIICDNWETILKIIDEELPTEEQLQALLDKLEMSGDYTSLGIDRETAKMTFRATKAIRDKYVLSSLAWDLGLLEELCELL